MSHKGTILITGVAKRVGFAIAVNLLEQGYNVVGTYRTQRPQLQQLEDLGARLHQVDLYDNSSIQDLIGVIQRDHSALRGIIHNASDWLPDNSDLPADEIFRRMMQVHASAPYQINLALQPLLETQIGGADIIHLTDYVAEKGSAKHIAYAASKAALQNMTLSFAARMAPSVQVNAIAPSLIAFNPDDSAEYKRKALNKSVLKTEPGFGEVVNAINYLLDGIYMTGRTIELDGGRHIR
ncbi:MAG: dihydromonapterin reductase [Amphritea sp.]|nr:dihydromonapterin reductase [Amphritea sp.]